MQIDTNIFLKIAKKEEIKDNQKTENIQENKPSSNIITSSQDITSYSVDESSADTSKGSTYLRESTPSSNEVKSMLKKKHIKYFFKKNKLEEDANKVLNLLNNNKYMTVETAIKQVTGK